MYKSFPLLLVLFICSCNGFEKKQQAAAPEEKMAMMDADRAFSKLSKEKGMKKAFIEYMDEEGVLLRPEQYPLLGAAAIDYLSQINDTAFSLEWEPQKGYLAKSGELGFTFGVYMLRPSSQDTVMYGTYVSIWKKQANGTWKYVLDTGNEGVSAAMADSL